MAGTRNRRRGASVGGILAALALVAFFAIAGWYGTFYVVGSNSEFCTTCHNMQPYYDQWKVSAHKDTPCVDCHPVRPGFVTTTTLRYWFGAYNPRPRAEVHDESCLASGCHDDRLTKSTVSFTNGIVFDHATHMKRSVRGERIHCTTCHAPSRHLDAADAADANAHMGVDMDVCFLCHFKGAGPNDASTGCGTCHSAPDVVELADGYSFRHQAYIDLGVECSQCHTQVTEGVGEVPDEACRTCHVSRVERKDDSNFIHVTHVTQHYVDCEQCHEPIRHGRFRMADAVQDDCTNCHASQHGAQREVYMGAAGRGVEETPSRMFATQVSCKGCHAGDDGNVDPARAQPWETKRARCVECHGEGYDAMLDDWKAVTDRAMAEVRPSADFARAALAKGTVSGQARTLLDDAVHNYDLAREGRPVHNPVYAIELLRATATQAETGARLAGLSAPARPTDPVLNDDSATCTALCHDRLGVPAGVIIDDLGVGFPHQMHFEQLDLPCTTCHPADEHRQVRYDPTGCIGCHHMTAKDADTCATCHPDQGRFLAGTATGLGIDEVQPDPMAKAVNCLGCHDVKSTEPVEKAVQARCTMCHGDKYAGVMQGWKADYDKASAGIADRLGVARDLAAMRARDDAEHADDWKQVQADLAGMERTWKTVRRVGYAHNPAYVLQVLRKLDEDLAAAESRLGLQ